MDFLLIIRISNYSRIIDVSKDQAVSGEAADSGETWVLE